MKIKLVTNSPEKTIEAAKKIAKSLQKPLVISLVGDLGAGKTTFTKGFALGLGFDENITSPTFTILNEYKSEKNNLYHFDMYRLSSKDEALELGFEEYFDLTKLDGYTLVEWAENVEGLLPQKHVEITIKKLNENSREIYFEMKGIVNEGFNIK